MIKGFSQIAFLTAISRVLGFARDTAYAIVFGPGPLLDAWFIAFRIPNLGRRLFGEGAASASLIPIYSEQLHNNPDNAKRLANTVITALFVVLAGLVLLGEVFIWLLYEYFGKATETHLILSLTAITLPYMILICLVAVIAGVLNVHRHFAAPAMAPIIMNLCIIAGATTAAWLFPVHIKDKISGINPNVIYSFDQPAVRQLFVVAVSVIAAGIFEFAVQIPPLHKAGLSLQMSWDIYSEPFKKVLRMMGPMIIGLAVTQINTLADDLVAWWFSGSVEKGQFFTLLGYQIKYPLWRGSVSYLGFAQHLYQLPLGIFGISLATALFPVMSMRAAQKDYAGLCKMVSLGIRSSIFVALPCSLGMILIAKPLISVWLRHGNFQASDIQGVVKALVFYSLGITGYFLQQIMVRTFYSMQDSKAPVRTGLVAVGVNFVLNIILIWLLGTGGLAASTAFCSYLQVVILAVMLRKRLGSSILENLMVTLVKTTVAVSVMWFAGRGVLTIMDDLPGEFWFNMLRLAAVIPSAVAVYLLAAKLLHIKELALLRGTRLSEEQQTYDD